MKPISTKTHGAIDYAAGLFLIAAPYLFGFADGSPQHYIAMIVGAAVIAVSLVTAYELSIAKLIPFRIHKILDMAVGATLLISALMLHLSGLTLVPFLLIGIAGFAVPSLTRG